MGTKHLLIGLIALVAALLTTADACAWGAAHVGFSHYGPVTGFSHVGYTGARGFGYGYGGYRGYGYGGLGYAGIHAYGYPAAAAVAPYYYAGYPYGYYGYPPGMLRVW